MHRVEGVQDRSGRTLTEVHELVIFQVEIHTYHLPGSSGDALPPADLSESFLQVSVHLLLFVVLDALVLALQTPLVPHQFGHFEPRIVHFQQILLPLKDHVLYLQLFPVGVNMRCQVLKHTVVVTVVLLVLFISEHTRHSRFPFHLQLLQLFLLLDKGHHIRLLVGGQVLLAGERCDRFTVVLFHIF